MKLTKLANNFQSIEMTGEKVIYFSYETPIAFQVYENFLISENDWGVTTGKHINKCKRIAEDMGLMYKQISHEELLSIINIEIY